MKRQGADTTRLWLAIIVLAVVVVALFIYDPFTGSPESSDPLRGDDDAPFVAFFPRDAQSDDMPGGDDPVDEVLGTIVEDESGLVSQVIAQPATTAGT